MSDVTGLIIYHFISDNSILNNDTDVHVKLSSVFLRSVCHLV